ncbi:alpha/beta hydrolase [Enterococcus rotai]|uniref:alpha/beta hydrolase n=1 Tax=Enterococcus rotai TaxID=118060 RepID=UPI0032B3B6AE
MFNYGKWYFINGVNQYIHVISNDLTNPILLYLHGGPGDAALPLIENFNSDLAKCYTLIIWELRGAGKSYYKFGEDENLTIADFVNDLKQLIEEILVEFKKEKIYLMGHSWGSIIGLKYCNDYPELVESYIGVGQVVNSQKMLEESRNYILERTSNEKISRRIKLIDTSFNQESWYSDLIFLMNQLTKLKVSLYQKTSYFSLYKYFITSKNYSFIDCVHRIQGSKQSITKLWQEVATVDFTKYIKFNVPIILIEGEYDYHVSSQVAFDFYQKIETSKKYICMKETAHFPQWTRAESCNTIINTLSILENCENNYIKV